MLDGSVRVEAVCGGDGGVGGGVSWQVACCRFAGTGGELGHGLHLPNRGGT